ncbi:MAG TPA: hypothetical protein VI636_17460 [Candidatus Angelobacter sp.]
MQAFVFGWFLLPTAIQLTLLAILLRRRLYRRGMHPFFFSYTLYSVVVTIPRLAFVQRPVQYPIFYWSTEIIYGVLAILALNEVFSRIFFLDYQEHEWLRFMLPVTVLLIIVVLTVWWRFGYHLPKGGHFSVAWSIFLAFNLGVHSVEGTLMLLFVALRWVFAAGWNRYDYGILMGFGVSALITMSADMARLRLGANYEFWYRYAPGIGYVLATIIWLQALWRVRQPQPVSMTRLRSMIELAQRNNEVIRTIHEWLHKRDRQ